MLCASAGDDQAILVRNSSDGSLVRTLPGNTNYVSSLAFSPDSTTLASGGGPLDPTIKLWRISDGALLSTIAATTNGVMALAWSPDGSMLASGGDSVEQTIKLWSAIDGGLRRTLSGHTNGVTALAFSPDGNLLASGGRRFDHAVKVWAVTNGTLFRSLTGHSNNIESVAFAPDGNSLASGSSGPNSLKVWKLSDSSARNFGTGTNPVSTVAFSPDGATLASSDRESIKFWNVASGTVSETVTQNAYRVTSVAFSPNGNLFLYGREDATVLLSTNTYGALGQPALTFVNFTPSSSQWAGLLRLRPALDPLYHPILDQFGRLDLSYAGCQRQQYVVRFWHSHHQPTSRLPSRPHPALATYSQQFKKPEKLHENKTLTSHSFFHAGGPVLHGPNKRAGGGRFQAVLA